MTRKGVWDLQGVRDKYLDSAWANPISLYATGAAQKLGDNQANVGRSSPIQIPGTDWSVVSISEKCTGAVREDGTLWVWGGNDSGALGQNLPDDINYSSPIQVGTNTNWTYVSGATEAMGAINSSGEMYVWGRNPTGRLGLNDTTDRSSPTQVPGTTWAELALGAGNQGIYRKTDGTLWSCGANNDGQLGQNNETTYSSPKQIGTATDWIQITCQMKGSWALRSGGTLWGWGEQIDGSLGFNQSSGKFSSPKQVPGAWSDFTCAKSAAWGVKTDGTLWSWGNNNNGQLGHNDTSQYSSPRQCGTDTTWSIVEGQRGNATDDAGIIAVKTDGTRWGWGTNPSGQLGLNDETSYSSPKQCGTDTKWSQTKGQMSLGLGWSMAMTQTLTPSQL
tara:strand:+ start:77 stop:1246 length:1170 start_codon:yes stop_codon:yes gene_type:complete